MFTLTERVPWLWEKLKWWIDGSGRTDEVFRRAIGVHDGTAEIDDDTFVRLFDTATSMVLFTDGEVDEFLRRRGPLLPADERDLVEEWSRTERSLFEVVAVGPDGGATLRDLRSSSEVQVATSLTVGEVIYAHPIFDGVSLQLIDGVIPIAPAARSTVLDVVQRGVRGEALAELIGAARRQCADAGGRSSVLLSPSPAIEEESPF